MAVCLNSGRDKVKGLYSEAYPIACLAGRSTATIPDPFDETKTRTVTCGTPEATFRDPDPGEHTNCPGSRNGYDADWEPIVRCPAGKVATGVTLSLRKLSNGRRYYDGLALRCRTVTQR